MPAQLRPKPTEPALPRGESWPTQAAASAASAALAARAPLEHALHTAAVIRGKLQDCHGGIYEAVTGAKVPAAERDFYTHDAPAQRRRNAL